eukprot:g13100.t1
MKATGSRKAATRTSATTTTAINFTALLYFVAVLVFCSTNAAAAASKPWVMPRDGEGGEWNILPEGPATASRRAAVSGGSPSGEAENAALRRMVLAIEKESESGQGGWAASVLNSSSAPPAHGSHAPCDAIVAKEAGAVWARGQEESGDELRGGGGRGKAEGGGGGFRPRRVQRQRQRRRQRLLSDVGKERADDEQQEARGIAPTVVAKEVGARYEDGGVLDGAMGRSLSKDNAFDHRSDRCFVAKGEEKTRCHANIFLFGVSKCGTTSLAHWMFEHPELRWVTHPDAPDKVGGEAHVMEIMGGDGHDGAYALTAPEADETDPVMDYTPHYSILADVPYKILHLYGEQAYDGTLKYVILLREPVARTISSWQFKFDLHGAQEGATHTSQHERRTLEWVFAEGGSRVNALVTCLSKNLEPGSLLSSRSRRKVDLDTCNPKRFLESNTYFAHVGKSVYVLQLRRWINLFGQENVKVIFLEEMAAEPMETLSSVFDFLGMKMLDEEDETKRLPNMEKWEHIVRLSHNLTDEKKKKVLDEQVTPELVQSMRDYFAPFNAELQELLGRPLPENWSLPPDSRV